MRQKSNKCIQQMINLFITQYDKIEKTKYLIVIHTILLYKMTNPNIGYAFLTGYLIGSYKEGPLQSIIFTYIIFVWGARSIMAFLINSIAIEGNYLKSIQDVKKIQKIFDDPNVVFEYNCWKNVITVKKNFASKIMHDSDQIDSCLKKVFNMVLCWDVFYHYFPLRIIHE